MRRPSPNVSLGLMIGAISFAAVVLTAGESRGNGGERGVFSTVNIGSEDYLRQDGALIIHCDSFDPQELDQIARRYVREHNLRFEFGAERARVFIPGNTNCLAWVWYSPDVQKPALLCKLDFGGKVVFASLGQAAQGGDKLAPVVLGLSRASVEKGVAAQTDRTFSADDVDQLVRAFVRDQKIDFNFSGVVFAGMAVPKSRAYLADVWYRHEFEKPALFCKVGWDGKILESHVGVARIY